MQAINWASRFIELLEKCEPIDPYWITSSHKNHCVLSTKSNKNWKSRTCIFFFKSRLLPAVNHRYSISSDDNLTDEENKQTTRKVSDQHLIAIIFNCSSKHSIYFVTHTRLADRLALSSLECEESKSNFYEIQIRSVKCFDLCVERI